LVDEPFHVVPAGRPVTLVTVTFTVLSDEVRFDTVNVALPDEFVVAVTVVVAVTLPYLSNSWTWKVTVAPFTAAPVLSVILTDPATF